MSTRPPSSPWPRLALSVRVEDLQISYVLVHDERETTFEHSLSAPLENLLARLVEQMSDFDVVEGEPATRRRRYALEGLGEALTRALLPEPLEQRLHALAQVPPSVDGPARPLWIVTNEARIPWSLVRLGRRLGLSDAVDLGTGFALAQWVPDLPAAKSIQLSPLARVVGDDHDLQTARRASDSLGELYDLRGLASEPISPKAVDVLDAFASDRWAAWHIALHGVPEASPDFRGLQLDYRGDETLRPVDFGADAIDLRRRRPFVFLDSCHAGRGGLTPTGIGGFAGALVESGASAVVASWWAHRGATGERFTELLWPMLLDGFPIGEAARRVRVILADERAEDPSRLAFQVLAHPEATVDVSSTPLPRDRSLASPLRHDEPFLQIRRKEWSSTGSPGALLRADHEVVPFHLRNDELEELEDWCLDGSTTVAVRLYTGPGGRGKTRLALELCRRFRRRGWRAGLVPRNELLQADHHQLARALASPPGALLAVVDYASSHSSTMNDRTGTVETLLSRLAERPSTEPVRIILLARSHDVWWRSLKRRLADRSSIPSRDLTWHTLGPLARAVTERVDSYHTARAAFRRALETTNGLDTEPDLSARHYEQVLLIHMKALAAVEGQLIAGEDGILDSMLEREEDFWCSRLERRRLDPSLLPGIKMAMALVTRLQGVSSQTRTVGLLAKLRIFADQPRATLMAVAQLLHEIYPGERWIMPLEPDLLGEHLDLDLDDEQADEVDDLIYGERSASPDSADSL